MRGETTFYTFSYERLMLIEDEKFVFATINIILNLFLSLFKFNWCINW